MSDLISGKEALIALSENKTVEYFDKQTDSWVEMDMSIHFSRNFRIKPKTIKINGIEVPSPFEPKNGEDFYYLDCTSDNYGGWAKTSWRNVESDAFKNNTVFGAWRTEEEIKQVVDALRSIFNVK